MTLDEIKSAVHAGVTVYVGSKAYCVMDSSGHWLIQCDQTSYCIGLTWADGRTLNAPPEDFFTD